MIRRLHSAVALALLPLLACGSAAPEPAPAPQPTPTTEQPGSQPETLTGVQQLSFHREGVDLPGTFIGGIRWRDGAGEHTIVLTEERTEDSSLHLIATALAADGSRTEIARDSETTCEFDLVTNHWPESHMAADIDGDGLGEASFAWALSCTSDVSPMAMRLYVVDGDQLYRATGTSRVRVGEEMVAGGEMEASSLDGAPEPVRGFVSKQWSRLNADQ